jgi:hypothetical protein
MRVWECSLTPKNSPQTARQLKRQIHRAVRIRRHKRSERLPLSATGTVVRKFISPDDFHVEPFESRIGGHNRESFDLGLRD